MVYYSRFSTAPLHIKTPQQCSAPTLADKCHMMLIKTLPAAEAALHWTHRNIRRTKNPKASMLALLAHKWINVDREMRSKRERGRERDREGGRHGGRKRREPGHSSTEESMLHKGSNLDINDVLMRDREGKFDKKSGQRLEKWHQREGGPSLWSHLAWDQREELVRGT